MTDDQFSYLIGRLETALERQEKEEGEIATTPTVVYCFECDDIAVDTWLPEGCVDHPAVSSDGYEHGGIQSAITVLTFLNQTLKQPSGKD